ncbi:hypothetical protein BDY21DRAFT_418823 [Lineolata rhizophorae]|uniref:Uncharacterized protein n=1 Tax=Lineolata rhizophorae TaxID=578093 RepID=A0A6A6PAB0_9PEZI|nr:hypothetical protein BDY21DRAFT_418823 [Lineolata rhizophorae]
MERLLYMYISLPSARLPSPRFLEPITSKQGNFVPRPELILKRVDSRFERTSALDLLPQHKNTRAVKLTPATQVAQPSRLASTRIREALSTHRLPCPRSSSPPTSPSRPPSALIQTGPFSPPTSRPCIVAPANVARQSVYVVPHDRLGTQHTSCRTDDAAQRLVVAAPPAPSARGAASRAARKHGARRAAKSLAAAALAAAPLAEGLERGTRLAIAGEGARGMLKSASLLPGERTTRNRQCMSPLGPGWILLETRHVFKHRFEAHTRLYTGPGHRERSCAA